MSIQNLQLREKAIRRICSELNKNKEVEDTIKFVLAEVKTISECEAVYLDIVLHEECPLYSIHEVMREHHQPKKRTYTDSSSLETATDYSAVDTVWASFIQNISEHTKECFTEKGSFWTNDAIAFLQNRQEEHKTTLQVTSDIFTYRTIVWVPVTVRGNIIGTLRIYDKKINQFSCCCIEFLEIIAEHIGLSMQNNRLYTMMFENTMLKERIREQEQQMQQLQAVENTRNIFFANLSHELRTPLNLLFSSLQLLTMYNNQGRLHQKKERVEKQFKIMYQNSYRMIRLINNSLDISKIDVGSFTLERQHFDVIHFLRETVWSVQEFIFEKGVFIQFQSDIPKKEVYMDWMALDRIMLNLISNAIKFTQRGGRIEIRVKSLACSTQIIVKDSGIGISKDKLQNIFQRFQEGHSRTNKISSGTGLGLSLVKSLVEMHDGSIWMESQPEQGTCAIVEIPNAMKVSTITGESNAKKTDSTFPDCKHRFESLQIELSDIFDTVYEEMPIENIG